MYYTPCLTLHLCESELFQILLALSNFHKHIFLYILILRNYNIMMVGAPNAQQVAERSEGMKENYLATVLSKSL